MKSIKTIILLYVLSLILFVVIGLTENKQGYNMHEIEQINRDMVLQCTYDNMHADVECKKIKILLWRLDKLSCV